jgi:Na+-driven multidrug efflux pump
MARGMSRRDKLVLQIIRIVALVTFLFGVWMLATGMLKSVSSERKSSPGLTNSESPAKLD